MALQYKIKQRSSDRDFTDVKEMGQANTEQNAYDILKSYAARCSCVNWTITSEIIKFDGVEVSGDGEVLHVIAWIEKEKN